MDNLVVRVISALCEDVGTPRALAVKLLVHHGEWAQLQELRMREPWTYDGPDEYWRDALVTDILRKCDLDSGVDREAAAEATFLLCEKQCHSTNVRLSRFLDSTLFLEDSLDERVYDFIGRWRKNVADILGTLPSYLTPRFSGGATYADSGKLITIPDKMSSTPTITEPARCLLPFWAETLWASALVTERPWGSDPKTVRGNIFFTVPKDGKTFRGCCKEPSLNVAFQLDVGRLMKSRLHRIGIDLRSGQQLHRQLAREASVTGDLATIDMSNASDTLCRVLVKLVLPDQWHELLNSLRATHTRMKRQWYRLEKFSSMGNGFTFELESLLFATLARSVIIDAGGDPDLVKCYGDDLIVPAVHYRDVTAALRMFGFTPNMKKTFAEGPFRESCGGDFFDGTPVRAHFLKELPDEPQKWIALANGLRRVAFANADGGPRWALVRRAWLRCLDPIPIAIRRCRGPEHLGDVVIHDEPRFWEYVNFEEKRSPRRPPDYHPSWERSFIRAYMPVPSVLPWHHWLPAVQLASCTLGLPSRGITPRGGVDGYRIGVVSATLTSSWLPPVTKPRSQVPPGDYVIDFDGTPVVIQVGAFEA